MPISSAIKGLQSIKSMQNVSKSAIPNKEDSEFIKLYMYEKEKSRLRTEETSILLRLKTIQARLREIQNFYNEKSVLFEDKGLTGSGQTSNVEEKTVFRTISMDY